MDIQSNNQNSEDDQIYELMNVAQLKSILDSKQIDYSNVISRDHLIVLAKYGMKVDSTPLPDVYLSLFEEENKILEEAKKKNILYVKGIIQKREEEVNALKTQHQYIAVSKPPSTEDSDFERQRLQREKCCVYFSNLPPKYTEKQLKRLCSRYGVVQKIKMYKDESGESKGDALVTFSTPLHAANAAVKLDTYQAIPGWRIKACPADFGPNKTSNNNNNNNENILDTNTPSPPPINKNVVILHNMYTIEEINQNPNALDEIEQDVEEECVKKIGNVIAVSADPDGIVTIRFESNEEAKKCILLMNGRKFNGNRITAKYYEDEHPVIENKNDNKTVKRSYSEGGGEILVERKATKIDNEENEKELLDDFFSSLGKS